MSLVIRAGGVASIDDSTLEEHWRFDWHDVQQIERRWYGLAFHSPRGRFAARRWVSGFAAVEEEAARRFGAIPWRITDPGAAERLAELEVQECFAEYLGDRPEWRDADPDGDDLYDRMKRALLDAIRATNALPRDHFIWEGLAYRSINMHRVHEYLDRVQDDPWAQIAFVIAHGLPSENAIAALPAEERAVFEPRIREILSAIGYAQGDRGDVTGAPDSGTAP